MNFFVENCRRLDVKHGELQILSFFRQTNPHISGQHFTLHKDGLILASCGIIRNAKLLFTFRQPVVSQLIRRSLIIGPSFHRYTSFYPCQLIFSLPAGLLLALTPGRGIVADSSVPDEIRAQEWNTSIYFTSPSKQSCLPCKSEEWNID